MQALDEAGIYQMVLDQGDDKFLLIHVVFFCSACAGGFSVEQIYEYNRIRLYKVIIFLVTLIIVNKEKFNKKFGQFVFKKRTELGMTQSGLASLIGNNPQNISRLERGEVSPTLYWLTLLAKAFEMKLSEL